MKDFANNHPWMVLFIAVSVLGTIRYIWTVSKVGKLSTEQKLNILP